MPSLPTNIPETPLPLTQPVVIGLDLARHRTLCVTKIDGERALVPLAPHHDGLILRWIDEHGAKHRVSDRILDLAGIDQDGAIAVARDIAECVFPEGLPTAPFVAVPPAFGAACRSAVADGFAAAGVSVSVDRLIDRPLAALAAWLTHRSELGSPAPSGPLLAIDNDGGQLSAAAIDTEARRVIRVTPISSGPDDPSTEIITRLRTLVHELDRYRSHQDLVRSEDWSQVSGRIDQVAVSGSMAEHPALLRMIAQILPAAAVVRDGVLSDLGEVVGFGLTSLDALEPWSAGWPTLDIAIDGRIVRPHGQIDDPDTQIDLGSPAEIGAGSVLSFHQVDGSTATVRIGPMEAEGIVLPKDLAPHSTLRLLPDGRVLVLGGQGIRPLTFRVDWPLAPDHGPVGLTAVGRRPLQLVNPTVDRSHRATAA